MMRSVSFVDRLEVEFSGNHFAHALAIGDVDSDGLNELVIGNVDGVLAIFKGDKATKPWKKCSELGTVVCVGVGDLINIRKNVLVCINAEGQCFIFNITSDCYSESTSSPSLSVPVSSGGMGSSQSEQTKPPSSNVRSMKPLYTQTLPTPNVKVMCIAAIAPDGRQELYVGLTDRSVVLYRWSEEGRSLQATNSFKLPGQIGSLSVTVSVDGTRQLLVSQPGGTYAPFSYLSPSSITSTSSSSLTTPTNTTTASPLPTPPTTADEDSTANKGQQLPRADSISSASSSRAATRLGSTSSVSSTSTSVPTCNSPLSATQRRESDATPTLTMCDVVGQPQRRSPTSSTEIIGQIVDQSESSSADGNHSNVVALCTLDGGIRMLRNEEKQWELQVDHSLFAIKKLDVTGSGTDEIVVCAWDGMTYIVDQQRNSVRFQFEQNVSAFTAGYYGNSSGVNVPCLVYSTFSNRIFIYHDIKLPSVASTNLITAMQSKMSELPQELVDKLKGMSDEEKQKLFHQCLYNWDSLPSAYEKLTST